MKFIAAISLLCYCDWGAARMNAPVSFSTFFRRNVRFQLPSFIYVFFLPSLSQIFTYLLHLASNGRADNRVSPSYWFLSVKSSNRAFLSWCIKLTRTHSIPWPFSCSLICIVGRSLLSQCHFFPFFNGNVRSPVFAFVAFLRRNVNSFENDHRCGECREEKTKLKPTNRQGQ